MNEVVLGIDSSTQSTKAVAVELATGRKLDEIVLSAGSRGSAAVAERKLVITTEDGGVACFGGP